MTSTTQSFSSPSPAPSSPSRSEERFSRNAETDTLSLHDALPVCFGSQVPVVDLSVVAYRLDDIDDPVVFEPEPGSKLALEIGRAVQQECRDRHSFPARRSSGLFRVPGAGCRSQRSCLPP